MTVPLMRYQKIPSVVRVEESAMQVAFDFVNRRITVDGEGEELVSLFTLLREVPPQLPSITFTATGVAAAPQSPSTTGNGPGTPSVFNVNDLFGAGHGAAPPPPMREFVRSLS